MSEVEAQVDLGRMKCVEALDLLEQGRVLEARVVTMEAANAMKAALTLHLLAG